MGLIPIGGHLSGPPILRAGEGAIQYDLGGIGDVVVRCYLDAFISDGINIIRL